MFCCTKGFPISKHASMSFWMRCSAVLHRIWLYKNMKKETKSVYTVQFVRKSFIIFEDIFHVSYYEKLAGKIMFLLLCNSFEYLNYILLYLIQKIYTIHFFRLRFFFCIVFLGIINLESKADAISIHSEKNQCLQWHHVIYL